MRKSKNEKNQEVVFWKVLGRVYKLLATNEAIKIIDVLLEDEQIRSTDLLNRTKIKESQFHPTMKQLVNCAIIEKQVGLDRSVNYKIGPFGKNILKLSKPLLQKVEESSAELLTAT